MENHKTEKQENSDAIALRSGDDFSGILQPSGAVAPSVPWSGAVRPVKWSWACRHVDREDWERKYTLLSESGLPRAADVVLASVEKIGHHRYLETDKARRLRLYRGDLLLCAFGNRYATEVWEGRVLEPTRKNKLHLLSGSGMVGTVVSRHKDIEPPTAVSLVGYLTDSRGSRVNLRDLCHAFHPEQPSEQAANVIVVAGTGMSTGKTTVMRRILHELVLRGFRVAGCKLTGTASPRDLYEMRSTGALLATDFSDYGFPSTYGAAIPELTALFDCMVEASSRLQSDIIVMEIADGFLQRETRMLLDSEDFRRRVRGVIVAAPCPGSALCATDYIEKAGLDVWAVSGLITNSPLFMQEFSSRSSVRVASSRTGKDLADLVMEKLAIRKPKGCRQRAVRTAP